MTVDTKVDTNKTLKNCLIQKILYQVKTSKKGETLENVVFSRVSWLPGQGSNL